MAVQYENSEKGSAENVVVNIPAAGRKGSQWIHTCSPQYLFLIVMLIMAVLVSLGTLVVFLTRYQPTGATDIINSTPKTQTATANSPIKASNHQDHSVLDSIPNEQPSNYPEGPNSNFTLSPKLKIVNRMEWLSQSPVMYPTPLSLPIPYVFIMDTQAEECTDQGACTFHVRFLQSYHIDSRGWDDIIYNFLIGGDGFAYEGRGWKTQGAHTYGYNSKSIGIAFIGNFNRTMPPEKQITAAKQLINIGVEKGYLDRNFKLLANRQVGNSSKTPGLALYEELQKWPHWSEQP